MPIDTSRIDATFPRAGQNNDSQGFRDNFANIKAALNFSGDIINELQTKALLKSPITGSNSVDNNMNWLDISRVQLKTFSETYYDAGVVGSNYEINYSQGTFQRLVLSQNLTILFNNFPPIGQFGRLKIWFVVTNSNHRVLLPPSVIYGINNEQIINQQLFFPEPGDYLLEIGSVDHGLTFWFIDFANLGGSKGRKGATGATGVGATGATGPQGPAGQFGGLTLSYRYRNITANAWPGDGYVAFNEENISTATEFYISDKDIGANLVEAFLRTIDDSTSPIKGHFKVSRKQADSAYAIFAINSITENSNYFIVSCSYIDGRSTFINTDEVFVTFARTGDVGPPGATGATGPQGIPGTAIYRGATGATGPIGATGLLGGTGPMGATGVQGIPGPMGFQGSRGDFGYTGSHGLQGFTGSQGIPGAAAAVGYVGSEGATGPYGYTGSQGIPGIAAYRGATGSTGPRGATGPIGATGMQGAPGGYTGSVGDTGSTGATGATGATGPKGESSFTWGPLPPPNPTVGDRWFDTVIGAEVIWTDDGDTFQWVEVAASGFLGRTGFNGSRGDVGYTGSRGDIGFVGPIGYTGSQGIPGAFAALGYTGSAGSFPSRITVTGTTPQLPKDTNDTINITGFKGYILYKITVLGAPAWVQIYNNDANRIADAQRPFGTAPGNNIGLITEITTTQTNQTISLSPAVLGYNDETPITTNIPLRVTNRGSGPATIIVALTLVKAEE